MKEDQVVIIYTNYRGQTAPRRILPYRIEFGSTEWHPEPQWLLRAHDFERGEVRVFALKDVLAWDLGPQSSTIAWAAEAIDEARRTQKGSDEARSLAVRIAARVDRLVLELSDAWGQVSKRASTG